MKPKKLIDKYLAILKQIYVDRRFKTRTIENLKRIIYFRLQGATLQIVADKLKCSKVRVHVMEKEFLLNLDRKQSNDYIKLIASSRSKVKRVFMYDN